MTDFRFSGRRKTNGPSIHALKMGGQGSGLRQTLKHQ